jgi:hypothetical protein
VSYCQHLNKDPASMSYFERDRDEERVHLVRSSISGFGGLAVSVMASGTQVRGFKPGRIRRNFKGGKILSTPFFGREVKPWVPCRRFAACKRSLNVPWKSSFRQNYRSYSPPISSNFRRWSAERVGRRGGILWPKLERPKRAVQKAS